MCIRVVERYAVCKCVYYVHGVDQCSAYGRRGHEVEDRTVLVGHTCPQHSGHAMSYNHYSTSTSPVTDHYAFSEVRGVLPDSFENSYYHAHR
ncbi:hypothetical protein EDC01DRAFT_235021 [Geopyxis carbonaria]|nr:hypothetical protein EDC01DRAFT_235021 [Geopyxis carbonaria]